MPDGLFTPQPVTQNIDDLIRQSLQLRQLQLGQQQFETQEQRRAREAQMQQQQFAQQQAQRVAEQQAQQQQFAQEYGLRQQQEQRAQATADIQRQQFEQRQQELENIKAAQQDFNVSLLPRLELSQERTGGAKNIEEIIPHIQELFKARSQISSTYGETAVPAELERMIDQAEQQRNLLLQQQKEIAVAQGRPRTGKTLAEEKSLAQFKEELKRETLEKFPKLTKPSTTLTPQEKADNIFTDLNSRIGLAFNKTLTGDAPEGFKVSDVLNPESESYDKSLVNDINTLGKLDPEKASRIRKKIAAAKEYEIPEEEFFGRTPGVVPPAEGDPVIDAINKGLYDDQLAAQGRTRKDAIKAQMEKLSRGTGPSQAPEPYGKRLQDSLFPKRKL